MKEIILVFFCTMFLYLPTSTFADTGGGGELNEVKLTSGGEYYRIAEELRHRIVSTQYHLIRDGIIVEDWKDGMTFPVIPAGEYTLRAYKMDVEGYYSFFTERTFAIQEGESLVIYLTYFMYEWQVTNSCVVMSNIPSQFVRKEPWEQYLIDLHNHNNNIASYGENAFLSGENLYFCEFWVQINAPLEKAVVYDGAGSSFDAFFPGTVNVYDVLFQETVSISFVSADIPVNGIAERMDHQNMPWKGFDDEISVVGKRNSYPIYFEKDPLGYYILTSPPEMEQNPIGDLIIEVWPGDYEGDFSHVEYRLAIYNNSDYEGFHFLPDYSGEYQIVVLGAGENVGSYHFNVEDGADIGVK